MKKRLIHSLNGIRLASAGGIVLAFALLYAALIGWVPLYHQVSLTDMFGPTFHPRFGLWLMVELVLYVLIFTTSVFAPRIPDRLLWIIIAATATPVSAKVAAQVVFTDERMAILPCLAGLVLIGVISIKKIFELEKQDLDHEQCRMPKSLIVRLGSIAAVVGAIAVEICDVIYLSRWYHGFDWAAMTLSDSLWVVVGCVIVYAAVSPSVGAKGLALTFALRNILLAAEKVMNIFLTQVPPYYQIQHDTYNKAQLHQLLDNSGYICTLLVSACVLFLFAKHRMPSDDPIAIVRTDKPQA